MLGTTLHHRFRLEQVLHRAPSGPLYLATDERSGELLALKLFPAAASLASEDGLRYCRAMERLAALAHPHLLAPRHTGAAEGVAFQVLPYLPADDLAALLAAGPLAPAQGAALLRQLAEALAALHGAGLLHLNLKPSNVLIPRTEGTPQGALQAVLCDPLRPLLLGPAAVSSAGAEPEAAACLAPEQVPWLAAGLGAAPDARTDLYALGVLGFRMLTGALPFTAATVAEVLHQQVVARPPDPCRLRPELPPRLGALLLRLLAKRPAERYPNASALLADLATLDGASAARSAPSAAETKAAPRPLPPPDPLADGARLHGREPAREALLSALARAGSGQGALVWLSGEPGSGRRSLVRDLLPHLEAARALLLPVSLPEREWCAPLQLPADLLSALLARWEWLPDEQRRTILQRLHTALGENAAVLTALVPALRTLLPAADEPAPLPLGRERLRTLHVLCEALLAVADSRHPLVLWIENAAAADPDSQEWLAHLMRRLHRVPVLVLAGIAPDAGATRPLWGPLQATLGTAAPPAQRVELAPLTVAQAAAWLADALGLAEAAPARADALPERLAAWLVERWGGRPLALSLALRLLLQKGLLRCEGSAAAASAGNSATRPPDWHCDWAALERASWPESLAALVQHRLELLPDGVLPVLQAVAASPDGCSFAVLGGLLPQLQPAALLERVEGAIAGDVLLRDGARLRFSHERLREAARRMTAPGMLEAHHLALGAAEEAADARPPLQRLHGTALHYRHGGDDARYLEHGCRLAAEAGRQQALRGLCQWTAHLQPLLHGDPRLAELLLAGGIAHAQLDNPELALALLGSARALGLPEPAELEALAHSAWAERARGNRAAALALVETGLARAGEALPANPVGTALARLSGAALRRYESLRSAALGERLAPLDLRERRSAELLALASLLLAPVQPFRAALADERILRLAAGRAPSPLLVAALVRLGEAEGDPDGAPFTQARALLQLHRFPHAEAAFHAALGRCRMACGQWRAAEEALQAALVGFRQVGALPDEAETLLAVAECVRLQGRLPLLRQVLASLHDLATLLGDSALLAAAAGLEAYARALGGELTLAQAGDAIRQAAQRLGAAERGDAARHMLALGAELALAAEDLGEYLAIVRGETTLPPPTDDCGHERLRAVLAEGHLVQAALLPDESDHHLQQAHALLRDLREGSAPLRPDLARVEVLERFLFGAEADALRLAQAALAELDGQGVRLAAAVLRLRVADGLKQGSQGDWLRWGGEALTAFDALDATLYLQAARRLLELAPPEEERPPLLPPAAGAASGGALAPLLERLAQDGALEGAALRTTLLDGFVRAGDAAYGAWFVPAGDGRLVCVHGSPAGPPAPERLNQWLAESVWRAGRTELLEHYRPATAATPGGAVPEPCSLVCLPIGGATSPHGVVMLGSPTARLIFQQRQAEALSALGRAAQAVLDINARLERAQGAAQRLAEESQARAHLLRWSAAAAEAESLAALLDAYCAHAATPQGCSSAVLCLRTEEGLALAALHGAVPEPGALEPLFPLPFAAGQAEAAMTRCAPIATASLDAPPASAAEQALLRLLGGGAALWLPLMRQGQAFGVLLLVGDRADWQAGAALELTLLEPLRALAPAIQALWQGQALARELSLQRRREGAARRDARLYRRLLPPGLPTRSEDLEPALARGIERTVPVLVGELPGLSRWVSAGGNSLPASLQRYFERVQHGLALHEGTLARIQHQQWIATYPASVDGALWGAQTLYQLLLELRDEATAQGGAMPPTGLGLHLGSVVWGALPAGEALTPIVAGSGIRTAARLAAMSIGFRCGLLVSQDTVEALGDPGRFDLRHLGRLRPAPGEARIDVFELYSVREPDVLAPMRSLQAVWDEALREFQLGRWRKAAGGFQRYMQRLPQDRPARYFLRQCRERAQA